MSVAVHNDETNVAEITVCIVSSQLKNINFDDCNKLANSFCGMYLSLSDCPLCCVLSDTSASGDTKSRMTDSSQSPSYRIRAESEQVSLYSPEQSSLHESEGLLLYSVYTFAAFYYMVSSFFCAQHWPNV